MVSHEHTAEQCAEWNHQVPGSWYGSNWAWVPCQEHPAPPEPLAPGEVRIGLAPRS